MAPLVTVLALALAAAGSGVYDVSKPGAGACGPGRTTISSKAECLVALQFLNIPSQNGLRSVRDGMLCYKVTEPSTTVPITMRWVSHTKA